MLEADDEDTYRDVTVSFLDQQGDDFRSLNFLESFITQYAFPELDRGEGMPR